MLAIVKLRLMQLKNDYKSILLMTSLAILLSFVFGSSTGSGYKPLIAIVDLDNTDISNELISRLKSDTSYRFEKMTYEKAKLDIEKNKLNSAIVIDIGFEDEFKLAKGISASIMAIENGVDIMNVEFMLKSQILNMKRDYKIALEISYLIAENTEVPFEKVFVESLRDIEESWKYKRPINVVTKNADGALASYDSTMHSILGFTVMFAAFTIIFSIGGVVEDKELKTWDRMMISPMKKMANDTSNINSFVSCPVNFIVGNSYQCER